MDRLKIRGYLILALTLYVVFAFVLADINVFAWHWIGRLILILSFFGVTIGIDLWKDKK